MAAPSVLLVESHDDSRVIYATVLQHHGFAVHAGACPDEALRNAGSTPPDLVVVEFSPPREQSLAVVRRLRADPLTRAAPVVVLSTTMARADREQLLAEGVAAYLLKPCPPLALLAEAQRLLGR